MSGRLFYSDSFAAARMTRHFGMKMWNGGFLLRPGSLHSYLQLLVDGVDHRFKEAGGAVIHADSLHLLVPQVGDVIHTMLNGWVSAEHMQSDLRVAEARHFIKRGGRIIQRNGIAFHWPESEAA